MRNGANVNDLIKKTLKDYCNENSIAYIEADDCCELCTKIESAKK